MLFALVQELKPTHLAVAYESEKEPTFRVLEFPAYKATRVPLPPEDQVIFDSQLSRLEEFIKAAKIASLQAEGFEADDLVGTVTKSVARSQELVVEVIIASNDRDLMQLISPRVRFCLPAVGKQQSKFYTEKDFFEEYGFQPASLVDYKALRGDPSDNIPGVRGIGEKTASELVKKYGTVDEVYKHILEISPTVAQKLADGKKDAELSRRLATIVSDAPADFKFEELKFEGFNRPEVRELFGKWGFNSLLKKMTGEEPAPENKGQMKLL